MNMKAAERVPSIVSPPSWEAYCEEKSFLSFRRTFRDPIIFTIGNMKTNNLENLYPSEKVYEMYLKDLEDYEEGTHNYNMDLFLIDVEFKIYLTNTFKLRHGIWKHQDVLLPGLNIMDVTSGKKTFRDAAREIRMLTELPMQRVHYALANLMNLHAEYKYYAIMNVMNARAKGNFEAMEHSSDIELVEETYSNYERPYYQTKELSE